MSEPRGLHRCKVGGGVVNAVPLVSSLKTWVSGKRTAMMLLGVVCVPGWRTDEPGSVGESRQTEVIRGGGGSTCLNPSFWRVLQLGNIRRYHRQPYVFF